MSIRRGTRGWRAVAALAALSGVVAGCTPGTRAVDDPTTPPPATATPSATPTPTVTPTPTTDGVLADGQKPEPPAALDEPPTIDGAIAVLAYFLKLYPYAQNTGDLADIRALSHPDCVFCASVIDGVEELDSFGLHVTGGGVRIEEGSGTEIHPGRWFSVDLEAVEAASQEVRADGSVAKEYPASTYTMNAAVVFEEGAWTIRALSYDEIVP